MEETIKSMYNIPEKHFFYKENGEKTSLCISNKNLSRNAPNPASSFERNVFSCYNHKMILETASITEAQTSIQKEYFQHAVTP